MKNKLLILLITIFVAALCAFGISACRGEAGKDGVNIQGAFLSSGALILVLSNGDYVNVGQVSGTDGLDGIDGIDGLDGIGITDIKYNAEGELVITFANGTVRNIGVSPKVCEHVYGDWIVETTATCVTQGYKYHECELCGYVEHEITPAHGHDWDERHAQTVIEPVSCTDEGWELVTCSTCGESQMKKIEAHTHLFIKSAIVDGRAVKVCLDCGELEHSSGFEIKAGGVMGDEYTLVGLGTCTDEYVVVPDGIWIDGLFRPLNGIAKNVFNNSDMKGVYLSKNINTIDASEGLFSGCDYLEVVSVSTKNTVYRSDGNCIVDINSKTVVAGCSASSIPSDGSVTTIGPYAFCDIDSLTKIIIPDKIVTLGASAFNGCIGLTQLNLGGSTSALTSIGMFCFYGCEGLETVTITNVPTIGAYSFAFCTNLEEVWLATGCAIVGANAFVCCTALQTVHIAKSVWSISDFAFGCCGSLTDVRYAGSSSTWWSESAQGGVISSNWNKTPSIYQKYDPTPENNVTFGSY